jgi:hypothetical protein
MPKSTTAAYDADALARPKSAPLQRIEDRNTGAHENRCLDGRQAIRDRRELPSVGDGIFPEASWAAYAMVQALCAVHGVSRRISVRIFWCWAS